MDVRIITVVAGLVAGLVGVVFLAPEMFAFAGLPESFSGLGPERIVTGLALLLLGLIGVLSELDPHPKRSRRPRPGPVFGFDEQPAPAGPSQAIDPMDQPLDRPFIPAVAEAAPVPERHTLDEFEAAPDESPVRLVYPQPEPELPLETPGDPRRDPPDA